MKKHAWLIAGIGLLLGACAQGPSKLAESVFYPPLPQQPRVQFLTGIFSELDIGAARESKFRDFVIGKQPGSIKALGRLVSVEHEPGKIYVVDKSTEQVVILDLELGRFDYLQDPTGIRMQGPGGIFADSDGYKYVADVDGGKVVAYNERNEFSRTYTVAAPFKPLDVAGYKDRLYIANFDGQEVIVMDKATGEVITTIGGVGKDAGAFSRPTHLTVDESGNLYVVDSLNFRIQMFDVDGEYVKELGYYETGPGGLARPKGIDIDRAGHLYSVDAAFDLIQIYDVETTDVLLFFAKRGMGRGSVYMATDISVDYDPGNIAFFSRYADPKFKVEYLIYQVNALGRVPVNVYAFGEWSGKLPGAPARPSRKTTEPAETGEGMPSLDDVLGTPGADPAD